MTTQRPPCRLSRWKPQSRRSASHHSLSSAAFIINTAEPDFRYTQQAFLFLHRFVKLLELLLFDCQVFGEGGVIKVCNAGIDRLDQPQKAFILDQLAEALAKLCNTI